MVHADILGAHRCRKLLNFRIWPSSDGSKSWDQNVRAHFLTLVRIANVPEL